MGIVAPNYFGGGHDSAVNPRSASGQSLLSREPRLTRLQWGISFRPCMDTCGSVKWPCLSAGRRFRNGFQQFPDMLGRVFAAAAFWFYVGWVIDRQNRGRTLPLITKPKLNVAVQLFLLVISALLLLGTISQCSDVIVSLRLWGIRSAIFEELGIMVWLVAFTIFFARKAVFAARRLR